MEGKRVPDHRRLLRIALTALPVLLIVLYWFICWTSPTTVLLVRHADREGSADDLSEAGDNRALELVHVMEKAGLRAIYHTEARRTQQTAGPIASALGITPTVISASDTAALVDDIRTHHTGHTVLVVGHSSVPRIIAALGGPSLPDIDDSEYDNLFILTRCRCDWPTTKLVGLQYGALSPSPAP